MAHSEGSVSAVLKRFCSDHSPGWARRRRGKTPGWKKQVDIRRLTADRLLFQTKRCVFNLQ